MGRDYHVTGGHEAMAQAAQRRKRPSRLGLVVLRMLGYKGRPLGPETKAPSPRHARTPR